MTIYHYAFRLLALPEQLVAVWQEGSFLATRWEDEAAVNLYHMEGNFFAEVHYHQRQDVIVRTGTFTSRKCLEDYTPYIRLDDLKKESPDLSGRGFLFKYLLILNVNDRAFGFLNHPNQVLTPPR